MSLTPLPVYNPFTSAEIAFLQNFAGLSYAQGDVLYIDSGGDIARLPAGTSGYYLKTQGAGADPVWDVSSSSVAWGAITGTLANQTDLQSALNAKQDALTLGTGVETALGVNVGTAGSFIVNGGALGTPSSGVATNFTGTASGLTAGTVTTNANLTGEVTSTGNAAVLDVTAISNRTLVTAASGDMLLIEDATDGALKRVNASDFIGGSGTPGGSDTQVQYNNSGSFGGITGATTDGTYLTLTAPRFVDGGFIADSNGNELIEFGVTASAVNHIKIINGATANFPQINAVGGDTNVGINFYGKGTGAISHFANSSTARIGQTTGLFEIGADAGNATLSSIGNFDLILKTGNATTGTITMTDGANGNIALAPNGTGAVSISTTLELGHATDTTISRVSAGVIAVEGVTVPTVSSTNTLTNKTLTTPTINGATLNGDLAIDGTPNTDDTWNGRSTNTFNAGATIAQFEAVYLSSSSTWLLTDADAVATAGSVMIALAGEAGTNTNPLRIILPGTFVRNDAWAWTPGVPLYLGLTPGEITATAPSATDDVVRIVGHAVTADVIFWNPSNDWATIV